MSETILKIGHLDLDLQGQISLQTSKIFLTFKIEPFECYFLLFNEYLNVLDGFVKQVTLTLTLQGQIDLQGHICNESSNVCVIPCDFLVKF